MATINLSKVSLEKANFGLSVLALAVAIISPFVAYHWLDPTLKKFSLRGRLQVSSTRSLAYYANFLKSLTRDKDGRLNVPGMSELTYEVDILNIGDLPAREIKIVAKYSPPEDPLRRIGRADLSALGPEPSDARGVGLSFEPPVQFDSESKGNELFVTIKRALAPGQTLTAKFLDWPIKILVSNEHGETTTMESHLEEAVQMLERLKAVRETIDFGKAFRESGQIRDEREATDSKDGSGRLKKK